MFNCSKLSFTIKVTGVKFICGATFVFVCLRATLRNAN